jgi:hypothetical protein
MSRPTQYPLTLLLLATLAAPAAQAQSPAAAVQWRSMGPAQYVCGGVSDEGLRALHEQRDAADSELLFTSGSEGAYLAEVAVSIQGKPLMEALAFNASGPLCLLKLPRGSYKIVADYKGVVIRQDLKIDGVRKQTRFNWPAAR